MRGIEGYRGVLAGGYAPMPLIPMGIASWRKDAHTPNTHGHPMSAGTSIEPAPSAARHLPARAAPQHGAGQAVRMRIVSVLMIGSRMISVLTTRRGGREGRRPPGQVPRKV